MQIAGEGVKNKVGAFSALNMDSTELMHYVWIFPFLVVLFFPFLYVDNSRNMVESVGQPLVSENKSGQILACGNSLVQTQTDKYRSLIVSQALLRYTQTYSVMLPLWYNGGE